jgi:hypothetical protein
MSLKTSRSMTFIKDQLSQVSLGRRSQDSPPVPPLPKSLVAAMSKPLPPSPLPMSSTEQFAPSPLPRPPLPKRKPRKKRTETIKPPDLQHIPRLLPIFKEMVSRRAQTMSRSNCCSSHHSRCGHTCSRDREPTNLPLIHANATHIRQCNLELLN